MGTDIHAYIEIKRNGEWRYYNWQANYYLGTYDDGSVKYDYGKMFDDILCLGRNYDLFAILADVRNGRGFAGCRTSDGFRPISLPRGLPLDVSAEVAEESERWGIDGHSHSWLTLPEMRDYDYEQQVTLWGVVDEAQFIEFEATGSPSNWCGDVGGSQTVKVTNEEMREILNPGPLTLREEDKSYFTQVSWTVSYRQAIGEYWFRYLDELALLAEPKNVRLVFWFDN